MFHSYHPCGLFAIHMKDRLSALARVGGAEFRVLGRLDHRRSVHYERFFMDQAPTSFLALARKRSRSPPTKKIGECIKSTSFIDGRVPTGQRFGFMHYTRWVARTSTN
uniref:Uncharacterized protein n=1 Tax=Ammopiptanthus mongolicus TaxID=126911 RepID=A0A4P8PFU0_AMMMO|nr:hypothetical protein [Ammopiptanthus mongolicus]